MVSFPPANPFPTPVFRHAQMVSPFNQIFVVGGFPGGSSYGTYGTSIYRFDHILVMLSNHTDQFIITDTIGEPMPGV